MAQLAEKHSQIIEQATAALLSRASNSRGLTLALFRDRVERALEKYLFIPGAEVSNSDVREFIEGIRADELCLIIACEQGDEKAWEDLVSAFDTTVRSAARKICSGHEEAEDLASSIWAELYGLKRDADGNKKSKLAYYSGRGSLAGWLRAIVAQLGIDQIRKQSKFVQIEEDREFENLAEASSHSPEYPMPLHHADNPEESATAKQVTEHLSDAVGNAISSLDDEDRLILKLYYFDDLKLKDIARTFGYHEATASRKLVRIQDEIRRSVERSLRSKHGWREAEIKEYMSAAAASLGMSVEKLLGILVIVSAVQDLWF